MDAAKLLIDQAKVDPLTVTMLIEVLEHTWASVADQFQGHPAKIYGPITIANYLVTLAETGERDALSPEAFGALPRPIAASTAQELAFPGFRGSFTCRF